MENVLIEILVGLPGSGKTHYAKEIGAVTDSLFSFEQKNLMYINFDEDVAYRRAPRTFKEILNSHEMGYWILHRNVYWNHWVFDGLFLTNDVQRKIVLEIKNIVDKHHIDDNIVIQFVYFKEDREACLFNDSFRNREKLADITIKSAYYEKPNIDELQKDFPQLKFNLIEKEVHKMNTYERLFKVRESYQKSDVMRSDEWCLGGTWGDYQGNSGTIGAEEQPTEFEKFDDLLTDICPNITMLQYKKLYRNCVTTETRYERDYYGGSCEYAYYECDLRKLYNMLVEMNLIEED